MKFSYILLLALAPAIYLMKYVWKKDKTKEPTSMLIFLAILGALACLPAAFLEGLVDEPIQLMFGNSGITYNFVKAFFGVALIEEGCKFLFMFLYTRNHKEFNGLFDGMIYAIFVSLGFAALENVFYVMEGGLSVAVTRAVMSVPGHMFFAVFMGYYYSMWHVYKLCHESEKYFANLGMIKIKHRPKYSYKHYLFWALAIPVVVHGFYDFCLFVGNEMLVLTVLIFVVLLYIICFGRIKKLSRADMEDYQLIPLILCRKYPELIGIIIPSQVNPLSVSKSFYLKDKGVYYTPINTNRK